MVNNNIYFKLSLVLCYYLLFYLGSFVRENSLWMCVVTLITIREESRECSPEPRLFGPAFYSIEYSTIVAVVEHLQPFDFQPALARFSLTSVFCFTFFCLFILFTLSNTKRCFIYCCRTIMTLNFDFRILISIFLLVWLHQQ